MTLIDRTAAEALIPEDVSAEIIDGVTESSTVMRLATPLPNMSTNQRRMPVVDALVSAYFVSGDTGQKRTSSMSWKNKYIYAEELAVIVPIPENVLDDVDYPIWDQVRPRIIEAFGIAFDAAVFYGINAPEAWPQYVLAAAIAAGNSLVLGSGGGDLYDDIMGEGGVLSLVEEDGFFVTGHVAHLGMRAKLRGLRDDDGRPIFTNSMQEANMYELDGSACMFPRNGVMDPADAHMFSGDYSQLVYSIRRDISWKILTEATIYDTDGQTVLYALAQQDMIALRAVMRLGWQLPNPINRIVTSEAERYPFSVLLPAQV